MHVPRWIALVPACALTSQQTDKKYEMRRLVFTFQPVFQHETSLVKAYPVLETVRDILACAKVDSFGASLRKNKRSRSTRISRVNKIWIKQ